MTQIRNMFVKEFKTYFVSPIAYIVIAIFLMITGWFFFSTYFLRGQASLTYFFEMLPYMFSFIAPAVTMKLFSEEYNTGSYEMLLTLPVTLTQILIAKLAAAAAFITVMLMPTIVYALSVSLTGDLEWAPVIGGYIGAVLLGTAFSSIGLFVSSLTRNQIIAFILAAAVCFGLTMLDFALFFLPGPALDVVQFLSVRSHFDSIAKGVLDSRDLLYFSSIVFISLYAAYLALCEKQ
ncbi:MAG: ABC transporter permease subunit [Thermodesulfobacteriota bacterium]